MLPYKNTGSGRITEAKKAIIRGKKGGRQRWIDRKIEVKRKETDRKRESRKDSDK